MSNKQIFKLMISERLSEAAEDIFALFEQVVSEYQREIDRLKKACDAKEIHIALDPTLSLEEALQTDTVVQDEVGETVLTKDNGGFFQCKEEMEQVEIKPEEEPQMPITNAQDKNCGSELQPRGEQQQINNDGPEEQTKEGAQTDNYYEPKSEPEEDSGPDNDEARFGSDASNEPFFCSICEKRFYEENALKLHMWSVHSNQEPLTFAESNEQHLQPHMESAEAGPFSCPVCGKRFKLGYCLKLHKKKHAGEEPFKCTECSAPFTRQTDFIRHMRTVHSIEKPFKCSVCNKGSMTAHALKTHMLMHTGERPFKCPMCGKAFAKKVTLKQHMYTHTAEKPFSCTNCDKTYATKQNLTMHMICAHC